MAAIDSPIEENDVEALTKERTAESAVWQLALVLAWATECHLATLEQLKERKSSSQRDIMRQASIAAKLVFNCKDLNVPPRGLFGRKCTRLAEYLERSKEELMEWQRMTDK